jgi:uncharacterized protein YndB with AHSA1/START domain
MTNVVEKSIELNAPIERVWRALSDHQEFGRWFGVAIDAPFALGATSTGHITNKGYEHVRWTAVIERLEPTRTFAYTWHPFAVDPAVDYSAETPTLVEFTLEQIAGGTRLTVVESGFDALPEHRRAPALGANTRGWGVQMENIKAHVEA